jgi:hypothetical protein
VIQELSDDRRFARLQRRVADGKNGHCVELLPPGPWISLKRAGASAM